MAWYFVKHRATLPLLLRFSDIFLLLLALYSICQIEAQSSARLQYM